MPAPSSFPERAAHWILTLSFPLAIALPLARWAFSEGPDPDLELVENRKPAPLPKWPANRAEWWHIPQGLESYWNDAFGFRAWLVRGNAILGAPFGVAANPSVVIARDGWLFYSAEYTLDQFRGIHPLSDDETEAYANTLEARRRYLAQNGAHFLFVIAPEKSTIYPERVPARFGPPGRTPADQLVAHLHAHTQVDVLDLRAPVRAARAGGEVFLHTDTHWSDRGAFVGYREIVTRLARFFPALTPRAEADFTHRPSQPFLGDLGIMLGNFDRTRSETCEQWLPRAPVRGPSAPLRTPPKGSTRYAEYAGPADRPRAVFIHDSFLVESDDRALVRPTWAHILQATFRPRDLLGEQFSRAVFTWQYPFDLALIQREHPDVVIEEETERRIMFGFTGDAPPR